MFQLFLNCQEHTYNFQSKKWTYKLGENCQICQKTMRYRSTSKVCDCETYCHQKCLITRFKDEEIKVNSKIICDNCHQEIKFQSFTDIQFNCRVRLNNILTILLCFFLVAFLIWNRDSLYFVVIIETNFDLLLIIVCSLLFWIAMLGMCFCKKLMIVKFIPKIVDMTASAFFQCKQINTQQTLTSKNAS